MFGVFHSTKIILSLSKMRSCQSRTESVLHLRAEFLIPCHKRVHEWYGWWDEMATKEKLSNCKKRFTSHAVPLDNRQNLNSYDKFYI